MATNFKKAFDKTGVKQKVLAAKLDVTPQTITHWLRDGLPKGRIIEVAGVLDIPITDLLEGDPSEDMAKALEGLMQPHFESAREFMNLFRKELYALPVNELEKLAGRFEEIAETKRQELSQKD